MISKQISTELLSAGYYRLETEPSIHLPEKAGTNVTLPILLSRKEAVISCLL